LSTRELIGVQIFFADHIETVERIADDTLALGFLDVAIGERDIEVLIYGEGIE
jgi:hypothetical protein